MTSSCGSYLVYGQCVVSKKKTLTNYSKTCVKWPLSKRPKISFHDQFSLDAGQKYCRMLQGEHSAILLTFIKLPFAIKIFVLSIFEWSFDTGFTVYLFHHFFIHPANNDLISDVIHGPRFKIFWRGGHGTIRIIVRYLVLLFLQQWFFHEIIYILMFHMHKKKNFLWLFHG